MKLVLKKQVGGVMGQPQQLSPELMQLLMSLPKDIQQYVLSLPIEQQIQELTILMQNQLKALQQSPNQNIQRSINQQPQIQQQQVQQVPQQIAQQQAMKYGGKKLQGGGDVTSQAGKLVKLWSEDGKSFTWHNTKEDGKPDIGNTIDVGNNDTFEYNGKIYDITDNTKNSNIQSQEAITTQAPKITTYTNTKPKRVSNTGSAKGDAIREEERKDIWYNVSNKPKSKLLANYILAAIPEGQRKKENIEEVINNINIADLDIQQRTGNDDFNTEEMLNNIAEDPTNLDIYLKYFYDNGILNMDQSKSFVNRLKNAGIIDKDKRTLYSYQTGGSTFLEFIKNKNTKTDSTSKSTQPTSNNVVLNTSKPKSIGEKIANTAEFLDKWGTVAGLLGQAADDGKEGWSKGEIAAAVVGNAVDLFNPLGKLGLGMKAVGKASKLLKVVNKADDAIKAGKAAKELEEMAVKSKKAYDFASKAPNIVSSAAGKLGVGLSGINTVSNIANVSDQILKSKDAFSEGNYGEGLGRAGFALLLGNQIPKNIRSSGSDVIEGSKMIYDKTGKALNAGKELVKESASTVKRVAVETAPKVKRGMSYLADSQLDEYQKLFGKIKSGLKQADEDLAEVGKNKTMNPKIKLAKSKNKPSEVEDSKIINLVLGIPSNISDTVGRNVLNMSGKINRGIQSIRDFRLRPEKAEIPVTSKKGIDNSNILNNTGEVPDDSKKIVLSSTLSNPTDMSKTVMYGTKLDKVDLPIPSEKELRVAFKEELDRHLKNKGLRPTLKNIDDIAALMLDKYKVPGTNTENRFKEFLTGKYK